MQQARVGLRIFDSDTYFPAVASRHEKSTSEEVLFSSCNVTKRPYREAPNAQVPLPGHPCRFDQIPDVGSVKREKQANRLLYKQIQKKRTL